VSKQTINIKCSCGSDKFEFPANPHVSDTVTCAKCGASENYGVLQKLVAKQVEKQVEDDFKKMLRKAGFK
jgi:hypothetical protein